MSLEDKDRGRSSEIGIVGGSAAGLFAAHLLGQAGKRVAVLEGAEDFDPKPRTLIVTRRMSEILGRIGDGAKVNEIRRFELFTDGRVARIALRQPDIVVERSRLIRDLAAAARRSGAQVLLGRRFVSMEPREHSIALQMERSRGGAVEETQC